MFTSILRKLYIPFFITAVLLVILQTAVPPTAVAVSQPQQLTNTAVLNATIPLTNTLTFTYTEPFTSYECLDEVYTTAEWDVSSGQLSVPRLGNTAVQKDPAIVIDAAGYSYVVWADERYGNGDSDIFLQKLSLDGYPVWSKDLRVNSDSAIARQYDPDITLNNLGHLLIVWTDYRESANSSRIYAQRIDTNGQKLWEGDKRIDAELSENSQAYPDIEVIPHTNDFVVTWVSVDIFMQRLDQQGKPLWAQDLQVNLEPREPNYINRVPDIMIINNIAYIAWSYKFNSPFASGGTIYAQKLNLGVSNGIQLWDNDVEVATGAGTPNVALDNSLNIYVTWSRYTAIFTQKLNSAGEKPLDWQEPKVLATGRLSPPPFSYGAYTILGTVAFDESENMVLVWSDYFTSNSSINNPIYYQRFSKQDGAEISEKVEINQPDITSPYPYRSAPRFDYTQQDKPRIVWSEGRDGAYSIFVQGLNQSEERVWPTDRRVSQAKGGVMLDTPRISVGANNHSHIVYADTRDDNTYPNLYAQSVDALGNLLLPHNLQINQSNLAIELDDWTLDSLSIAAGYDGSLAAVWENSNRDVVYQTLDNNEPLADDVVVGNSFGDSPRPDITLDRSGAAYIVWQDFQRDPNKREADIVLQKIEAGELAFTEPISVHVNKTITHTQLHPALAYDEVNDSLFTAWSDDRNGSPAVYMQSNSPIDGTPQWAEDTLASTDTSSISSIKLITMDGYAYLFWQRSSRIYGQKVDQAGNLLWGDQGIRFDQSDSFSVAARSHNGQSYLYLTWVDYDDQADNILLQRLNPDDGSYLWDETLSVKSHAGWQAQAQPDIGVDSNGYVYVVWKDYRRGQPDIFAQKVTPTGTKYWSEDVRVDPDLYLPEARAQSDCAINQTDQPITWATLRIVDGLFPDGTSAIFFLSNGHGWEGPVEPDIPHQFDFAGSDLQWRVILQTNDDQTAAPSIDTMEIEYTTGTVPPRSVQVIHEGQTTVIADVYRNGQWIGTTDSSGFLTLRELEAGDSLVALEKVHEEPSYREVHDNYAYRVFLSSSPITAIGDVSSYIVQNPDQVHTLYVEPENPLILFNLVVSIEWNASQAYLEEIERAMRFASDYLYDFTDGQMAFGQVTIYNNRKHWRHADIQIMAKNSVRPHAYIGGLLSDQPHHVIRLGRQWDGLSGNIGSWDHPHGYRTIAHEFGHYGLFLYDEYFGYKFNEQGIPIGRVMTRCTESKPELGGSDEMQASVMDYHYHSTELSDRFVDLLWASTCEETAQFQLNNGESTWETLVRYYGSDPRWRLTAPHDRGGVLAGPHELPDNILAVPLVNVHGGSTLSQCMLQVEDQNGNPVPNVIIALYKASGQIINQGLTGLDGRLTIYGAELGDIVRGLTLDGGLAGIVTVGTDCDLTMVLQPIRGRSAQADEPRPYSVIRALAGTDPDQIEFIIHLTSFPTSPVLIVTRPDNKIGMAPPVMPNPETGSYTAALSFAQTEKGTGYIRVIGLINSTIEAQSDYRLQLVRNDKIENVFSNDGQLHLQLFTDSLPSNSEYFVVAPPIVLPSEVPQGTAVVGSAYEITAGIIGSLEKEGILTLSFNPEIINQTFTYSDIGLYRWRVDTGEWERIDAQLNLEDKTLSAPLKDLGLYALFAVPTNRIFVPIVMQ